MDSKRLTPCRVPAVKCLGETIGTATLPARCHAMTSKTYEQLRAEWEHRPDLPKKRENAKAAEKPHHPDAAARQSEFPVSGHGMNQESDQAKHNRPPKGAPRH